MNKKLKVELPKTGYMILSLEDRILNKLFIGKGMTISELHENISNSEYTVIRTTLIRMEDKGYVVRRSDNNDVIYYLTAEGVAETQYRINGDNYDMLFASLIDLGFPVGNVIRFLRNRLYIYYLTGDWNEDTLVEQYKVWCESNGLELYTTKTKKLEM